MIPLDATDTSANDRKPLRWTGEESRTSYEIDDSAKRSPIVVSGQQLVSRSVIPRKQISTPERLFKATADAKIWTSRLAMKLAPDVRKRIFLQLDRLHDLEDWFEGDAPLELESYKSFVRSVLLLPIASKPGLALTPEGRIIALWGEDSDRLSLEFLPTNRVRWVLSRMVDGELVRNAGEAPLLQLRALLAPYEPERWFDAS